MPYKVLYNPINQLRSRWVIFLVVKVVAEVKILLLIIYKVSAVRLTKA